jgi:hypothetical protein
VGVVFQLLGFGGEADDETRAQVEMLGNRFEDIGIFYEGNR